MTTSQNAANRDELTVLAGVMSGILTEMDRLGGVTLDDFEDRIYIQDTDGFPLLYLTYSRKTYKWEVRHVSPVDTRPLLPPAGA